MAQQAVDSTQEAPGVITDQQAQFLIQNRDSDKFTDAERVEIDRMLQEYKTFHTAEQARIEQQRATGRIPGAPGSVQAGRGGQTFEEASVENGIRKAGLDVVSFGNLLLQSTADPRYNGPEYIAAVNQIDQDVKEWRRRSEAQRGAVMTEAFGSPESSFTGEIIGENIAFLPFWFARAPKMSGYTRMVAENGAAGAFFGSLVQSGDVETLRETLGGATFGAMFGMGVSSLGMIRGIRSAVGRAYVRDLDKTTRQSRLQLERKVQEMTGDPTFSFSAAGISSENPWIVGLELGTLGEVALTRQNQLIETLATSMARMATNKSTGQIATDLHGVVTTLGNTMARQASSRYGAGLQRIVNIHGDDIVLDGIQYYGALNKMKGELSDAARFREGPPQAFREHFNFVDKSLFPAVVKPGSKPGRYDVFNRKTGEVMHKDLLAQQAQDTATHFNSSQGGLTSDEVVRILQGHNELMKGINPTLTNSQPGSMEHIGRYLKSQLLNSMKGTSSTAVDDIQRLTDIYAFEMQRLSMLREGVLGTLFGDDFARAAPDTALDALLANTSREQMRNVRTVLEQHAPDVLQDLKGAMVARIIQNSRDPKLADNVLEIDLEKFMGALGGKGNVFLRDGKLGSNVGRVGLGLFTPAEQQSMINAARSARVLKTTYMREFTRDTAGRLSDATINVVSQSAEFMARFLARSLGQSASLERIMLDPAAREALIIMGTKGPNSPAFIAATAFLASWQGEWMAHDMHQQALADQQAADQAAQQGGQRTF